MSKISQDYSETEIDLKKYIGAIKNQKKIFFGIFFVTILFALGYMLFAPKIYRASLLINLPDSGKYYLGNNELVLPGKLKSLILSNDFDEKFRNKLALEYKNKSTVFSVESLATANDVRINMDIKKENKDFSLNVLEILGETISNSYAMLVESKIGEISEQIQQIDKERLQAERKAEILNAQLGALKEEDDLIMKECKLMEENRNKIMERIEYLLEEQRNGNRKSAKSNRKITAEITELTNSMQAILKFSYLNENKNSDLFVQRDKLDIQMKEINDQINDFANRKKILMENKDIISNFKITNEIAFSEDYIIPNNKKVLVLSIAMGLFLWIIVVFFLELAKTT